MTTRRPDDPDRAREVRLRWLVYGGVSLGLVVMAVVFIVVGRLATGG